MKKIKQEYSKDALQALSDNKIDKFRELVKKAINNDDPEILELLGENLLDSGQIDQAEKIFKNLIKRDDNNSLAKVLLADILNTDDKTDDALLLLDSISSSDDNYLSALLQKADIYQTLGMEEVSESLLHDALEKSPNDPAIIFGLAELLNSEGKYQGAIIYYKKLLDQNILEYLGINIKIRYASCLAFTGHFEEAITIFKEFADFLLNDTDLFTKGVVLYQIKDYKDAIASLEELRLRSTDYDSLYLYLATCYEKINKLKQAYEIAEKGIRLNSFNLELRLKFAQIALKLEHYEQGIASLEYILKEDPDNIIAANELANIYLKQDKFEQIINLFSDKVDLNSNLAWAVGKANLYLDQLAEAKNNLLLAFADFKRDPEYLLDLINLFKQINDKNSLAGIMKMYLKLVPTDDEIAQEYEFLKEENNN